MNRRCVIVVLAMMLGVLQLSAQKIQFGTNMLGMVGTGTLNVNAEYAVARHWTVSVGAKYNPFTMDRYQDGVQSRMQLRQRSLSAGVRWWPWYVYSGWWVMWKAQAQEYNWGGIISPQTEEGQRYGLGLTAGYAMMLSPHWNVDFGLGAWGGVRKYVVYSCPTCGRKIDSGVGAFVLPNDLLIGLSYVF